MTRVRPIRYRRGKPLPRLRFGDVVDLSTWPLGAWTPMGRRAKIERCPKCGQKGERTTYRSKAPGRGDVAHFTHRVRYEVIFLMVLDSHDVPVEEVPA